MKIQTQELNIYNVDDLYNDLLSHLKSIDGNEFILDFSDVDKVDLSAFQLLLSLKKSCELKNIDFKISNISSKQVKQFFKMFNISKYVEIV